MHYDVIVLLLADCKSNSLSQIPVFSVRVSDAICIAKTFLESLDLMKMLKDVFATIHGLKRRCTFRPLLCCLI